MIRTDFVRKNHVCDWKTLFGSDLNLLWPRPDGFSHHGREFLTKVIPLLLSYIKLIGFDLKAFVYNLQVNDHSFPLGNTTPEVLGLQPGASSAAVRRAYHCLALLHHPDKGHLFFLEMMEACVVFCLEDLLIGGDDAVFKAIADAYKALTEAGFSAMTMSYRF